MQNLSSSWHRRLAWLISLLVASCLMVGARGQVPSTAVAIPDRWVSGYANDISGEIIGYPSSYPGQTRALLTRATDGKKAIEWEGEAPPNGAADERVTFVWHGGLASGYGAHQFTLSVNGTPCVRFRSGRDINDREWSIGGDHDVTLSFKTTKVGTFNELFGVMVLSVPRQLVASGRPRFSVVGEAAGSQDYYMTFLRPPREWARVAGEQAILRGGRRALRVEVSHIGDEGDATLVSGDTVLWRGRVGSEYTALFLPAPAQMEFPVTLDVAGHRVFTDTVHLDARVRPWEVHLLPHSHVDIGYSDPQPEVEKKQWRNLRDAVALAAKTAGYPSEARFRWNVEGLWSVESYLRQASPDERLAFVNAVKSGAIGLQANYTNILTGLASPEELGHWMDAAHQLRAAYGLPPIRSAMHTDIPGLSWTCVRALAENGARYFSSGPNYMPSLPDGGDRIGHTLHALGDKPFWWVSPSGNERVLFWMAGRGYSWFHGLNMGRAETAGRLPILDYLRELDSSGYSWDMVQVRYTIGGDNGPVDPALPDFVKAWNETFESPRLVIDTAEAMFAEFERRYGATLPERTGDMTPYWEDGAVSSAGEEAMVRASARRLVQAETVWALRDPKRFPTGDDAEAWRNVLLWHEHTWGAADSISQPDRPDVVAQWTYKRQFAVEADQRSKALLDSALDPAREVRADAGPALFDIVNTVSWQRKGVVTLPSDLTAGRDGVSDVSGRPLPSQRLTDGRLAVLVDAVPPFGTLRIKVDKRAATTPAAFPARIANTIQLGNGKVNVVIDAATGDLRSVRMIPAPPMGSVDLAPLTGSVNRYLYVAGRDPGEARSTGAPRIVVEDAGPLVATLRVDNDAPGARSLVRRVTVVAGEHVVRIEDLLDKTAVRTRESAHIAFPFDVPRPQIRVDEGGAVVVPERNQIDGSCRDFIGVHSAVDVANEEIGVALATLDAPLVEIGAVTDERQDPKTRVRTWRTETMAGSTIYAYLLNNYWHTNYKADQEGPLTFRFVLWPHVGALDGVALRRFSAEQEQPLLARPVTARATTIAAPFRLEGPGIVATSLRADGASGALLVRVYNASEAESTARLVAARPGARIRVETLDGDGRATPLPNGELRLRPFATAIARVSLTR